MDYGIAVNTTLGQTQGAAGAKAPMPDLGRIKAAAERVGYASDNLEGFLARFTGNYPPPTPCGATAQDPAQNYRNDIESLFEQVNRLEALTAAISQVG